MKRENFWKQIWEFVKVYEAEEELKKNMWDFSLSWGFFHTCSFQHESCSCHRHLGGRCGKLLPLTAYPYRDLNCGFLGLRFDRGEEVLGVDMQ